MKRPMTDSLDGKLITLLERDARQSIERIANQLGVSPSTISRRMEKLISKISSIEGKIVIDDEADYAAQNSKINRDEKTKINELVGKLLGNDWTYIDVTATHAGLNLNNTFENANDSWINLW
ncbi:AsnC family protein [Chloroflexota bacterium]